MDLSDEKKTVLAENDTWLIYINSMAKQMNRMLHTPDKNGISFEYYYAAVAHNKIDDKTEYIIENDEGKVIYASPNAEEVCFQIDMMKIAKRYEFDLIEMAKNGTVPKSV